MTSTNHVYVTSPHSGANDGPLYTVGFYNALGKWHPLSDHVEEAFARAEVILLNGGGMAVESVESADAKIRRLTLENAALKTLLEANTRLLQLVAPLLQDGPHVGKMKFLEEQIATNQAALASAAR